MNEHYNIKECDYNHKEAQRLYGDKTLDELKVMIEKFEKSFEMKGTQYER